MSFKCVEGGLEGRVRGEGGRGGSVKAKHHLNQRFRFSSLRDDDAIYPTPSGGGVRGRVQ